MSLNLVRSGGSNLSVLLHEAKTHVFSCVVLCCLCFSSVSMPDSVRFKRLVWSFLFIFSLFFASQEQEEAECLLNSLSIFLCLLQTSLLTIILCHLIL